MSSTDEIDSVLVVGMGAMGSEIALQCARFGLNATMFDKDDAAYDRCRRRQEKILADWIAEGIVESQHADEIRGLLRVEKSPGRAAERAQLLIETVPEDLETKLAVFREFEPLCPPETLICTCSSYFTPTMLLEGVQRRGQFAGFHFHEPVWYANVVDVMPHPGTASTTVDRLVALAGRIDQIPIVCLRERPGYVANAMLDAVLGTALVLVAEKVAPVDEVDRAWMGVMKTPIGPLGILDRIGLDTVRDIMKSWVEVTWDPYMPMKLELLERQVAAGRLGLKSGRGFYEYPHPDFERADFLRRRNPELFERSPSIEIASAADQYALQKYAFQVAGPVDFIINLAINAGIAWFFLRDAGHVPLFGLPSLYVFLAPMAFCVLLFATYFGHVNGIGSRRRGLVRGLPPPRRGWRRTALLRGLTLAVMGLAIVTLVIGGLRMAWPDLELSARAVIAFDAVLAGTLGYAAQVIGVLRSRRL